MILRNHAGSLALLTALALGCSVGDPDGGFSSSLTFGDGTDDGTPNTSDDGEPTESSAPTGSESGQGTGSNDGSSGDVTGDDVMCTPSEELCDGEDNDCDGEVDNGNPEGGVVCETGMVGACASGTTLCEAGAITCVPDSGPSEELCNGIDDDCNGPVDDNDPEGGAACDTGMPGVCMSGLTECTMGVLECIPEVVASAEVCDGLDNDCNGQEDDGNPGGGGMCSTGMPGICSAGTNLCSGGVITCQQTQLPEPTEICVNGLDDNCNGQVDEGCCAHDICVTGIALTLGCAPCVTTICGLDPWCCSVSWDQTCVDEVGSICGLTC